MCSALGKSIISVVALVCGSTRRNVKSGESLPNSGSIISHLWSGWFLRMGSSVITCVHLIVWSSRCAATPNEDKMSDGGRDCVSLGVEMWKSFQKRSVRRSAARSIAWFDVLCAVKSRPNILRPLERFSLFRDILPECVRQIGRHVVPGFGGESIEKGPVFITDPAPRESPDRAIGRVAEQASQGGTVGCPALGIQHAQMKLEETVFVAPEHRG